MVNWQSSKEATMELASVVRTLDGVHLHLLGDGWPGLANGTIRIEDVQEQDGIIRFAMVIPTSASDVGDFIWRKERAKGTTDKVVLTQSGGPVAGARVTGVDREGAAEEWTPSPSEQYRITFEVPTASLRLDAPLGVLLRWPEGAEAEDVATATGK